VSLFCRHNRFLADCPICSKGTALDAGRAEGRRPRRRAEGSRAKREAGPGRTFTGPYAAAGPYDEGAYEVRLERVPGGLRLAEWQGGEIRRRAPVLAAGDLPRLLAAARDRGVERADELAGALEDEGDGSGEALAGVSSGRAGELREELRVERVDGDRLRVARWILRPNAGWELQEAPVMLPSARYAEAFAGAARSGLLTS
jgi:hypothetical protein